MKNRSKWTCFILSVLVILIFSWCFSSYWVCDAITSPIFNEHHQLDMKKNKNIQYTLVDLEDIGNNTYRSLSGDGYVIVEFSEVVKSRYVIIDVTFKEESKFTVCQIFYAGKNEGFSKENVTTVNDFKSGKHIITLDESVHKKMRLDITNEPGVEFTINSIEIHESYISSYVIWIFCFVSSILIAIAFSVIFEIHKNIKFLVKMQERVLSLSPRHRGIVALMILSTITIVIVFLKLNYRNVIYAYTDTGADTFYKYLPQYNLLVNKIRNGTIGAWLPEVGYGYNIGHYYFGNPLFLITILMGVLFGTQSLPTLIVIYRIVGIYLSAYMAYKFLELFSNKYNIVMIGAYLYAFNGFAIIWGQHYVFFDYPLYTILVFYLVEKYLRLKHKRFSIAIILMSFACMSFSVYMTYMIYLPVAIYAIIRYVQLNNKFAWKEFLSSIINLGINVIIGFIGGLVTGLIQFVNILDSGRIESYGNSKTSIFTQKIFESFLCDDFLGSLQRFVSANLSGIASYHKGLENYYGEPQLFLTALFWLFLFQYIFTIHKHSKTRKEIICKWFVVILVSLAMFNKGVLTIMYAFSFENRRTTFVLFPVLIIMVVIVLENIFMKKIFSKIGFWLGLIFTFVLMFYNINSLVSLEKNIAIFVSVITVLVFSVICSLMYMEKEKIEKPIFISLLTIVIVFNVTTEMYISTNREKLVSKEYVDKLEIKQDNVQEVIDYIKDTDAAYYRLDKRFKVSNIYTDSFLLNYYSVSTYNSVMSGYTKEFNLYFMNPLFQITKPNLMSFYESPDDIIQYSLLGLKYVLSEYELPENQHYDFYAKVNDIYVYKNKYADSFTTFFDNAVLKSDFKELGYIDRNKVIQKALVINDEDAELNVERLMSVEEILKGYDSADLTQYASVNGKPIEEIYDKEIDGSIEIVVDRKLNIEEDVMLYMELGIEMPEKKAVNIYLDTGEGYNSIEKYRILGDIENSQVRYTLPLNIRSLKIDFADMKEAKINHFSLTTSRENIKPLDNPATVWEGKSNSEIHGEISCDRDGFLFIPIVYSENWKVYIDGEQAKTYIANAGFIAVDISEGNHKISMVYEMQEIKIGIICLGVAIVMALVYYMVCRFLTVI